MFRRNEFPNLPSLALGAAVFSALLLSPQDASAKEKDRELSSWSIAYSSGWTKGDPNRLGPLAAVDSVTMRRIDGEYQIFFHYTRCYICKAVDRKASYFSVDDEKARQIKALVDEDQIKSALERPCTLPAANAQLSKVTVRFDPPPAGYAPFAYDILLGCQSPELDEVKANLDSAIMLFSAWMAEYENAKANEQK